MKKCANEKGEIGHGETTKILFSKNLILCDWRSSISLATLTSNRVQKVQQTQSLFAENKFHATGMLSLFKQDRYRPPGIDI